MKKIFISIDFEDWKQITYLEKYNFESNIKYCDYIIDFFEFLKSENIPATVFVVGSIIEDEREVLRKIIDMGFELACHSFSHKMINKISLNEFEKEIVTTKKNIQKELDYNIYGFRAPSFSMSEEYLEVLWKNGYTYDSSYISHKTNEYSNIMDISKYTIIEKNIYKKNNNYIFGLPTINVFKKSIPLGGGGYFRLLPFFIYKILFTEYMKNSDVFVFYIHPFEIAGNIKFPLFKKLKFKDKVRFQLGREKNIFKFKKIIEICKKKGYVFYNFSDYIKKESRE